MAITDWPATERPREKLLAQGANSLSDAELLAIFLRTGCAGKSAVDLARDLLNQFQGLRPLLEADCESFCEAKGLGTAKFTQLQAVLEMGRRHLAASLKEGISITSADTAKQFVRSQLRHHEREVLGVLFLNNQHQLIRFEPLFLGTINQASVYPREIVKQALNFNAAAIIVAHNHPSGIAEPSQSDIAITKDIQSALQLIDIKLLDHLIVGNSEVHSMKESGWL